MTAREFPRHQQGHFQGLETSWFFRVFLEVVCWTVGCSSTNKWVVSCTNKWVISHLTEIRIIRIITTPAPPSCQPSSTLPEAKQEGQAVWKILEDWAGRCSAENLVNRSLQRRNLSISCLGIPLEKFRKLSLLHQLRLLCDWFVLMD